MNDDKNMNISIKDYYSENIKSIMKSRYPKFIKLKLLENLNFEFLNDTFSGLRLSSENYLTIYNNIQKNRDILISKKSNIIKNLKQNIK